MDPCITRELEDARRLVAHGPALTTKGVVSIHDMLQRVKAVLERLDKAHSPGHASSMPTDAELRELRWITRSVRPALCWDEREEVAEHLEGLFGWCQGCGWLEAAAAAALRVHVRVGVCGSEDVRRIGSAVVVGTGLVLTCSHVAAWRQFGSLALSSERGCWGGRPAEVIEEDVAADLALMRAELPDNVPIAALGDTPSHPLVVVGYPGPMHGVSLMRYGQLEGARDLLRFSPGARVGQRPFTLSHDATTSPGSSGSGVYDPAGRLIGVHHLFGATNEAVPLHLVRSFLEKAGVNTSISVAASPVTT